VKCVPAITSEVALFRTCLHQQEQALGRHYRAHRMRPGSAIGANGRQETQRNIPLVEQLAAGSRHFLGM